MKKRASTKSGKAKRQAKATRDLPVAKKSTQRAGRAHGTPRRHLRLDQLPHGLSPADGLSQGRASNHTGLRLPGSPL